MANEAHQKSGFLGVDEGQHAHKAGQREVQRDSVGTTPVPRVLLLLPVRQPDLDRDQPQAQECETRR
jgi:hypothetical protein